MFYKLLHYFGTIELILASYNSTTNCNGGKSLCHIGYGCHRKHYGRAKMDSSYHTRFESFFSHHHVHGLEKKSNIKHIEKNLASFIALLFQT